MEARDTRLLGLIQRGDSLGMYQVPGNLIGPDGITPGVLGIGLPPLTAPRPIVILFSPDPDFVRPLPRLVRDTVEATYSLSSDGLQSVLTVRALDEIAFKANTIELEEFIEEVAMERAQRR